MILITGFHHSGTSFLARCVERLGFNFGGPLDRHHEHEEGKKIDDVLIGDWQKPEFSVLKFMTEARLPADVQAYKNPRLMITWPAWLRTYKDCKFIVITRETNDVITSMMADKERSQDPLFWQRLVGTYSEGIVSLMMTTQGNFLGLDYKTMCAYPELTGSKIAHFLGRPEGAADLGKWMAENVKYKTYSRMGIGA